MPKGYRLLLLALGLILAEAIRPGTWREFGAVAILIVAILMLMLDTTELGITTPKKSKDDQSNRSQ